MELTSAALIISIFVIAIMAITFMWFASHARTLARRQCRIIRLLQARQTINQLQLVESTLNPHLFKNVFNSIQSHACQTYYALDKLANVLNDIVYDSRQPFVSAREEFRSAHDPANDYE